MVLRSPQLFHHVLNITMCLVRGKCLCNFHLELIETNFLGLLATIFPELLLQILDLLPVTVAIILSNSFPSWVYSEVRVQFCLFPSATLRNQRQVEGHA